MGWRFASILIMAFICAPAARAGEHPGGSFVSSVFDPGRSREIAYTLYHPHPLDLPADVAERVPVLLFSHGGNGSTTGHTRLGHFGQRWAAAGYVTIHVNHLASSSTAAHQVDRPRDVSFVLDAVQQGNLPLPPELVGRLETTRFGHAGHSFGAWTSMALAGGDFVGFPSFRDPRIVAIAPISPQGPDQFGGFDHGPSDNTWHGIAVPAFNLVGGDETDTNALGTFFYAGWRLTPFERYSSVDDKFQSILPGLDHLEMGEFAPPLAQAYLADNTRLFFDVYLRGDSSGVCGIGSSPAFAGQILAGKTDPVTGRAAVCPPPIGLPEPAFASAMGANLVAMGVLARCRWRPRRALDCGRRSRAQESRRPRIAR